MIRSGCVMGLTIFINADGSLGLFENGLRQNVLFLYQLFRASAGCERVYLINGGDGELAEAVEHLGVCASDIVRLEAVADRLDVLIVIGAALDPVSVRKVRDGGCRIINYKGGNGAVISMEAVVAKGARSDGERYFDADLYDEIWLTPQHWRTCRGWCRTMYRCAVRMIPHIWSPSVLKATAGPHFGYRAGSAQWRIGVLDPNITVMKTSHMPMLVCEEAYRRAPQKLKSVYVANGLRYADDAHFIRFARALSAVNDGVMTFEPRFVGGLFIRDHCDAVVTHQWENALNYVYWEALYGGYPLVHNSIMLEDAGYYYPDFDAQSGAAVLIQAMERHDDELDVYRARAHARLAGLDPLAIANIDAHQKAIEHGAREPLLAIDAAPG